MGQSGIQVTRSTVVNGPMLSEGVDSAFDRRGKNRSDGKDLGNAELKAPVKRGSWVVTAHTAGAGCSPVVSKSFIQVK